MKVNEVMTSDVSVCDLNASLGEAAKAMWNNDCGILPVLKDGKDLVGLITDRDICMGLAMRNRNPSAISVEEIMTGEIYSVRPDDDVQLALETMQHHKVRRLPVVDAEGKLTGLLSINDLTLQAEQRMGHKTPALTFKEVMKTYKAVCAHPVSAETSDKVMTATT
jgi:CBS domain-containing protein